MLLVYRHALISRMMRMAVLEMSLHRPIFIAGVAVHYDSAMALSLKRGSPVGDNRLIMKVIVYLK